TGAPVPLGALFVNGAGDEDIHWARTAALFAQADWELAPGLTLSLGGRASWDRKRIFTQFFDPALPPTAPYDITQGVLPRALTSQGGARATWFQFTPKVILNWRVNDEALVYASFARGYNAGGFSARAGTVADTTTPFDPEFINAYEVGGKFDLLNGRLRINAAAFYNDYKDKQEEAIEPGPPPTFTSTTVRNVAAARIWGLEFEASALLSDWLRLDGSLGILDAKYTDYTAFVGAGQFVSVPPQPAGTLLLADLAALKLRRTPKVTASISPTADFDLGAARLTLNGIARFTDRQTTEFFNSQRGFIPATWTFDASAAVGFGGPRQDRFRVSLFGRNLSDQQRISSFTNSLVDFSTVSVGRTWGLEFLVNY
ncbi:MAG: TonB-dependent receptor, partial [Thermaurantiacus sp.]